ncbi:MAG: hypothetical protein P3B98_11150, partial [Gemmatimonadota bacterium]|nr:hypothetical protein [Gemmatimonadota bacterium]
PVAGATVLWQVRDGGGTINPPASTTGASGLASVTWTMGSGIVANKAVAVLQGNYVLDSAVFTASTKEGPPASMTLTGGASLTARVASQVSSTLGVVVRDRFGHPVPKVKVTWLPLTAQSGTVTAINDSTDATGASSASWTTGTLAATQMAVARLSGVNDVTFIVAATADTSRRLTLISGNNQSTARGLTLTTPLVVRLADRFGNLIEGDTVVWNDSIGGGGSITPTRSATDANGLTNATWTLGAQLGAQAVRARIAQSRVTFAATARVGLPKTITKAGSNQAQRVATQLTTPLSVVVKDSLGQPVPGVALTWSTPDAGGSIAAQTDTTLADGSATALWTLGSLVGAQSASLALAGVTGTQSFTATASADTSRILTVTSAAPAAGLAGAGTNTLSVRLTDRFGNLISGDSINFADSTVGGGSFSSRTVATVNGAASTTWTLGNLVGTQSARARLMGRAERVSFTAASQVQFTNVFAGSYFTCALSVDDTAYCWGYNLDKQLGKGTTRTTNAPTTAMLSTSSDSLNGPYLTFRSIKLGRTFGCGLTVAKQMICWGRVNGNAMLDAPTSVTFTPATTVQTITAGERHNCMTTPSGQGACSGTNDEGALGDGTTGSTVNYVAVGPVGAVWSNLAAGQLHTCGIPRYSVAGSVRPWCWGYNGNGQVGDGTNVRRLTATMVVLPAGVTEVDSTSLVSGGSHSCAIVSVSSNALRPAGSVLCWGANGYGQLGDGFAISGIASSNVAVGVALPGITFTSLTAGENHTCGVSSTGSAYCWGRNNSGQLGDGTSTDTSTPVLVSGSLSWRSLSAGELFTCGVVGAASGGGTTTGRGTVYCWGDNEYGQLGTGAFSGNGNPSRTPVAVLNQRP